MDKRYVRSEITSDERMLRNVPAKRAIAALAATLIPSGATSLRPVQRAWRTGKARIVTHSIT